MSEQDVLTRVREAVSSVHMHAPVDDIMRTGDSRRRRRLATRTTLAVAVTGAAAAIVATVAVAGSGSQTHTPATAALGTPHLNLRTVAYTVTTNADGTVTVWTKQAYFEDPTGLQAALRKAGFPVLIKIGEFCRGPNDDGYLDPSGQGRGVQAVMAPGDNSNGDVVFTFDPKAVPAGMELFIGYLSRAQLAVTHGRPGSVERLVPANVPLVCTTEAPPPNPGL